MKLLVDTQILRLEINVEGAQVAVVDPHQLPGLAGQADQVGGGVGLD